MNALYSLKYINKFAPQIKGSVLDFGCGSKPYENLFINSDEYIGWFQFEQDKELKNAIEIGWRLKKQHWGNGYATEVAIALSEMGIEMGKTIVARAMIENLASIRVMEKAGLEFEKEFWGDYEPHSGSPDVLYKR